MKPIKTYIPILLTAVIILNTAGCTAAKAGDLMRGVKPNSVSGRQADAAFTGSMADFSIELLKQSATEKENSLISPLSVMLALAMTANGADGETLAQMETLLGGGIPLDELNEYLYSYAGSLPSASKSKLNIANSIWFHDTLKVEPRFLQKNADYYNAAAYSAAFDAQTVGDINSWVKSNTDGMINEILNEEIPVDMMMFLINAVAFDAEWQSPYYEHKIRNGLFTDVDGIEQSIDFMHSNESLYLDDSMATGFIKPYVGGYSFAALLPNEGVAIEAYIESLTGAGFMDVLENVQHITVEASMPKFEYDYTIRMNDALIALGMPDAFIPEKADFTQIAGNNLFIDEVLHKTYISVDELGTKAGAVSMVAMPSGMPEPLAEIKTVRLERPFVYAIIDNATNLPVFIGTVMTV